MRTYRSAILANAVTVSATGAEASYIPRFDEPVQAARLTLTIATASGTLTAIMQRGRPNVASGDTVFTSSTSYTWEDYISFTSASAAATQQKYITIYTTSNGTVTPSSGGLASNQWMGPPIGPGPFRLYYVVSGASAAFTLTAMGEFEF